MMHRIKILDSMRGLAAMVVLFHHVYTRFPAFFPAYIPGWLRRCLDALSELNVQAVLFFFFLSGFSICLSVKKGLPLQKPAINEYLFRRFKRILPLYYFTILFTVCCGLLTGAIFTHPDFSIKNLLGNLLFLQCSKSYPGNWFAPYGDNGPLWSLSFEMFYYLLLPAFLWVATRLFRRRFDDGLNRWSLAVAFIISITCTLVNRYVFFPFTAFATLYYVWYAGFFAGWLYLRHKLKADKNFLLLAGFMLLVAAAFRVAPSATLGKLFSGAVIASGFVLLFMARKKAPAFAMKNTEALFNFFFYRIGTGSYALYLLHYPVLLVLKKYEALAAWQLWLVVAATIAGAVLLEKYFVSRKWLILKRQYL